MATIQQETPAPKQDTDLLAAAPAPVIGQMMELGAQAMRATLPPPAR
jgi:hypothetical protein